MTTTTRTGGGREHKGRLFAYARYGRGKQLEFAVPWAKSEAEAKARGEVIARAVDAFISIGRRDLVRKWGVELAKAANDTRLAKVQKAIEKIVRGERAIAITGDVLFEEWARRYTSGELAAKYPDHVRAKDYDDDASRLRKYILPHVRDVPIGAFRLAHANLVMSKLPPMSTANRRHVAQILHRLMKLSVFPGQLRETSPIPPGWLPKVKRGKDYSCLFPAEEALLLANGDVAEAFRLLCGVLDREGMRLTELLDCDWWQWGDDCRTFRATKTKTGDPRFWAVRPDTAEAMRMWREKSGTATRPFAYVDELLRSKRGKIDRTKIAEHYRAALQASGVKRAELFADTDHTGKLRAHDMRATFVTISLAEGKTDTWIRDRTAHKSTSMIDRYRRAARQVAELELGSLHHLVDALGWKRSSGSVPQGPPHAEIEKGEPANEGGAGRVLGSPVKSGPSESAQVSESTEGGTRTLTSKGRRILNPLADPEGSPEVNDPRWVEQSREASRPLPSTLPAPPSGPLAPSGAEHGRASPHDSSVGLEVERGLAKGLAIERETWRAFDELELACREERERERAPRDTLGKSRLSKARDRSSESAPTPSLVGKLGNNSGGRS